MSKNPITVRVTPSLKRDQVEFLDKMGRDSKFSGGRALGHCDLIRALVCTMQEIAPDLSGVKTEDEIVARVLGK